MKIFTKVISTGAFLLATNLAFAANPVALNGEDLDQVNAGAMITIASSSAGAASGFLARSVSAGSQSVFGGIATNGASSTAQAVFGTAQTNATSGIQIAW